MNDCLSSTVEPSPEGGEAGGTFIAGLVVVVGGLYTLQSRRASLWVTANRLRGVGAGEQRSLRRAERHSGAGKIRSDREARDYKR